MYLVPGKTYKTHCKTLEATIAPDLSPRNISSTIFRGVTYKLIHSNIGWYIFDGPLVGKYIGVQDIEKYYLHLVLDNDINLFLED